MSFATLNALADKKFWGGSYLADNSSSGLKAILNSVIGKINEVLPYLNGVSALDALLVGDSTNYYLTGDTWMIIDGVNPPTFSMIRMQDQSTGDFYDVFVTGAGTVTTALAP